MPLCTISRGVDPELSTAAAIVGVRAQEDQLKELLNDAATRAAVYLAGLRDRRVAPSPEQIARLQALGDNLARRA